MKKTLLRALYSFPGFRTLATWARKFFENWKTHLRWSRLELFQKFAAMIERHWEGIISYCHPDHKVSLGFMEGFKQQDPGDSTSGLWHQRQGISATQGAMASYLELSGY